MAGYLYLNSCGKCIKRLTFPLSFYITPAPSDHFRFNTSFYRKQFQIHFKPAFNMRFSLTIISALAAFATANPAAIRERAVSENVDALEPISVQFANLRLFQDPSFKGAELVLFGDSE